MYCQKCGTKNDANNHFCASCGEVLNKSINPGTPLPEAKTPVSMFTPSKTSRTGKPLIIALIAAAALIVIIVGLIVLNSNNSSDTGTSSRFTGSTEAKSSFNQDAADSANDQDVTDTTNALEEIPDENTDTERFTVDELTALVQKSKSATVELIGDPNSRQSLTADDDASIALFKEQTFEKFKEEFTSSNFQSYESPYYFIPEYRITFDTGVSYTIMQDFQIQESILKFDGNPTIWCAPKEVYTHTNIISTTPMDDFSNMHIFHTDSDEKAAMNNVLNSSVVELFILDYYRSFGYEFEGENIFKMDEPMVGGMPETDPNLHWVMIPYSVKPSIMGELPDNPNLSIEDGWITGGVMAGAIWNEAYSEGVRSYLLGVTPFTFDVNGPSADTAALPLYEQSGVKSLVK